MNAAWSRLWLPVLVGLILAGPACSSGDAGSPQPDASSDARTLKERLDDASLATQVRKALLDTLSLRAFDFDVAAQRGRVALRGTVRTAAQRTLAEQLARGVPGVRTLVSDLVVADSVAARARPPAAPHASKEEE